MTTTRRIGLTHRVSRDRKISKDEDFNSHRTKKVSRQEEEPFYCSPTFYQNSQNNEIVRKISRNENPGLSQTVSSPRRKTPVFSRPKMLEESLKQAKATAKASPLSKWREFLMLYETWIQVTLLLSMIFVSIYIIFVEGQSLFSKSA